MAPEEFVKEVNSSEVMPHDFENMYKEFQGYQKNALETLKEFHRICEGNGSSYQLAYGSLLGAMEIL